MPLKIYDKKLDYSYTYGVFPTLDLFKFKRDKIVRIILNTEGIRNEGYHVLEEVCKEKGVPLDYDNKFIKSISAKDNTYAVGMFRKYETKLAENENHVVLVNPSNTGNLGTIIRTMVGFGYHNLAIIKPAVDIFEPKVVRSSMGSIFNLNFEYFDTFEEYQTRFSNKPYTFMLDGATEINEVKFEKPFALVFGNESQGLEAKYQKVGQSVYIKHNDEIDSLNLSIAVGIGLFCGSKK